MKSGQSQRGRIPGCLYRSAGLGDQKGTPLWRSLTKERGYGANRVCRFDVFRMIKRRVWQAELGAAANCHTFRATGITAYLLNGGNIENAQAIAAHESPRTTKLYDPRPTTSRLMKSSGSGYESTSCQSMTQLDVKWI
jgi:hypothetical protein